MSRKSTRLSGDLALDAAFNALDLEPLTSALGVDIPEELFKLALSHRSFANENGHLANNERLEYLGDAVLSLSVAEKLYDMYSSRPESDLSKMRASIVSRYGLADIARDINLGAYVLLGKGELHTDGRNKDSILADTMEALLGAIYLAHDFYTARGVVWRLFAEKIARATAVGLHQDWKTTLQERLAEYKLPMADYQSTSEGPEHDQLFTVVVKVFGRIIGTGQGRNKKQAEQQAAHNALDILNDTAARNELLLCRNSQK
ncbi:ribonuclease III [Corynebacterium sp. ES2794-CONJ1]|uniref:ribonuclease III n=1 Tax=unclassified Corynebacterium TaxID=2624378 RepID=UPI002166EC9B|nr:MULTISPECIES: ribonuclease III [unclassified Corynebacterium]MCS4489064.1 ribonuclease III [Corynebacterium sp. ES2775-CONJ]MCS4490877.1 ribonuclease III [Corynebacterium sp. ES2715-CONJ3]MCS4531240.1 ribonuclease III [Corynebacterium sp. ES2730-CONJ]MCU9518609.1 ribonuclease III [Corynebacterium sp. ES2794-CONJ1]